MERAAHRWGSARGASTRGVPWGWTACSPHGAPFLSLSHSSVSLASPGRCHLRQTLDSAHVLCAWMGQGAQIEVTAHVHRCCRLPCTAPAALINAPTLISPQYDARVFATMPARTHTAQRSHRWAGRLGLDAGGCCGATGTRWRRTSTSSTCTSTCP